jgi:hypothetical protein
MKGTTGWISPQVMKHYEENSNTESEKSPRENVKSDVFSEPLICCYFLLDGENIFWNATQ